MNTFHRRLIQGFAACAVALALAGGAAAAPLCQQTQGRSLDQRLAAKADEGAPALRRFLTRTQAIYGLDWSTAVARADRGRRARASCAAS